ARPVRGKGQSPPPPSESVRRRDRASPGIRGPRAFREVVAMERIDIEQARKRAKELVRTWRASGAPGRLADAQREIVRGLGFPSWPALVHHAEAAAVERERRRETFVDWATNGRRDRAQALLDLDPSLSGPDISLLLGDVERVAGMDPNAPVVHRGWAPLVYVTHSAFLGGERTDALVANARALLAAGAERA